ncbi:membrane protein implicated in regulation of membrane protease activity [Paenarthrobacter nitroguajacolicus]|uniref:hypothetical protein n=1 Tax=Paenarthrobacter nitroguajacolicus TaxID=211146 RepID=UPI0028625026|nr:hypothetical protein [Paenarthrobacter nitroguajacolicus]MDR6989612.1 membrane protein implicated in regulation of membrane protease activity [Paenarthrobacter nitroguajacolicus]
MNRKPLIWLLLALVLAAYAVSIFVSNPGQSPWSLISGIIVAAASLVMVWRYSRELKNNRPS